MLPEDARESFEQAAHKAVDDNDYDIAVRSVQRANATIFKVKRRMAKLQKALILPALRLKNVGKHKLHEVVTFNAEQLRLEKDQKKLRRLQAMYEEQTAQLNDAQEETEEKQEKIDKSSQHDVNESCIREKDVRLWQTILNDK